MESPKVRINLNIDTSSLENKSSMFSSVNDRLNEITKAVVEGSKNALDELGEDTKFVQTQSLISGGHFVTGALVDSIESVNINGLHEEIGSSLYNSYAPSVIEYGRDEVRPIYAKYLHYFTKDGEEVFSKYSSPFPADPYVSPSADFVRENANDYFLNNILDLV